MKDDATVVANGTMFETGISLEDAQQVEDSAGNIDTGDGEDADIWSDNDIHIAAQDRVAGRVSMVQKR